MEDGSLDALEAALNRAELLDADCNLVADERDELLAAIARQIRTSLRRLQRRRAPAMTACPVHLGLLRHLASSERW